MFVLLISKNRVHSHRRHFALLVRLHCELKSEMEDWEVSVSIQKLVLSRMEVVISCLEVVLKTCMGLYDSMTYSRKPHLVVEWTNLGT